MGKAKEDRQFEKFRRTGSPRALGAVYDLVAPELLKVAQHLAGDPLEAEDLVQRTFVTAIERASGFREGERVLPWLLGILAFHAMNEKRRYLRRLDPTSLPSREVRPPEDEAQAAELEQQLEVALAKLPREQRSVLKLRLFHRLSAAQIASALSRPVGTVRSQLARGMENLREILPAGLVASATLAFGLTQGLRAIREGLLLSAASSPPSKLAIVKGYSTWALAPIAEVLLMKKVLLAVLVLLGSMAGVQWLNSEALDSPDPLAIPLTSSAHLLSKTEISRPSDNANLKPAAARKPGARTSDPRAIERTTEQPWGSLQVRLLDSTGSTVSGEICTFQYRGHGQKLEQTEVAKTNGKGLILLEDLPAGSIRVQPLRGAETRVTLRAGKLTRMDLTLPLGIQVNGSVVDPMGEPIPHAEIWLSKRWSIQEGFPIQRSDGAGRFTLHSVTRDNYIGALARGYGISYLQAPRATAGEIQKIVIVLDSIGARVLIEVLDQAGNKVEGAEVLVGNEQGGPYRDLGDGASGPPPPPRRGRTSPRGELSLSSIPVGPNEVLVRKPGFCLGRENALVVENRDCHVRVTLQPEGLLYGKVVDENGAALALASVWSGTPHRFSSSRTTADAHGDYRLGGLPSGQSIIWAESPSVGKTEFALFIEPGEQQELDMVVRRQARIQGQLLDAKNDPLVGFTLVATTEDEQRTHVTETSKLEGKFCLLVAPEKSYRILVRQPGDWRAFPLLVKAGLRASSDGIVLRVPNRATETVGFRVEVQNPDGSPSEGARLQVWHVELKIFRTFEAQELTGEIEVQGLPPGTLQLSLHHPNYQMLRLGEFELEAMEFLDLGIEEFLPLCRLKGRLSGDVKNEFLKGIVMRISQVGGAHGKIVLQGREFMSSPLAPGRHRLSMVGDHILSVFESLELGPGENPEIEIPLVPCGLRLIRISAGEEDPPPSWVSALAFDSTGRVVWSGACSKQAGGTFLARVSALPGQYRIEATGSDGRTVESPFKITGMYGDDPVLEISLLRER